MAANPVEIAQLRVMADYFLSADYPYYEELREAFKLLRVTGCRIQEIFEIERWTFLNGYAVRLQPQKFNNERTIVLSADFNNFIAAVQGQYKPFLGRTYSQLQFLFQKINPYGKLYSSTKEITNYFFRYLFIRELDFEGFNLEAIAEIMGYTSTTAVHNYLDADLTSTIEVPVTPTDPYPIGHMDIVLNNTQFNGTSNSYIIPRLWERPFLTYYARCIPLNTTARFMIGGDYSSYNGLSFEFLAQIQTSNARFSFMHYNTYSSGLGISASIPSLRPLYDIVFTCDFSEVGSSGGDYRNIKTEHFAKDWVNGSQTILNRLVNANSILNFVIGARKAANGVITSQYQGSIEKLMVWNRILTSGEINTLFNL